MEGLVENFKNLGGTTIGEHKRNFNGFYKKLDGLSEAEINLLLSKIEPQHLQEKIFYVHLLGRFKKIEELYNIFYQNNVVLNKIILKNYSRDFLQDLEGTRFVNEVCLKISFSMRMKIINKLSHQISDTKKADDFFNAIFEKYGIKCAEKILIACSLELIQKTFEVYKIQFKSKELIKLYRKSLDTLLSYLQKRSGDIPVNYMELFLRYLAVNDVDTFYKILKEHNNFLRSCRLNLKGYINFIEKYREFYIKEAKQFSELIKKRNWVKKYLTKEEFVIFLKNAVDENNLYVYYIIPWIEIIPIKDRASIIFKNYKEINNKDIWEKKEVPEYYLNQLLPLLPLEDRLKFPITLEHNYKYFDTKQAFTYVQQKINLTQDIYARQTLLTDLIENCKINNDHDALLEVLKYFCKRHKNEILQVRETFLRNVLDTFKNNLKKDHWNYLNEIVLNIKIKEGNFNCECDYLVAYIHYKISNNIDFTDELKNFMQEKGFNSWRILEKFSRMEKACIIKMRGLIEETFKDKDIIEAKTTFLKTLIEWNESHPRAIFDLYDYPDCIEALMTSVQKCDVYCPDNYLLKVFTMKNPSHYHERDNLLENYIKNSKKFIPQDLLSWLIQHKPALIHKNFDILLENSVSIFSFYEVFKMHWNGLADLFKMKAIKIFNNENLETYKRKQVLNYLCYEDDFLEYIKGYIISEDNCVIDCTKKETKDVLQIQREILQVFKKTLIPNKILETILKFCASDYLQYALETLYYMLNNTPEKDLEDPLRVLSNRSVSVRKHAVFLAVKLSPTAFMHELLSTMCGSEKNASARKYLLKTIHKYFIQNQSDDMYALFKSQVSFVPQEDSETLSLVLVWSHIPAKFLVDYVILIWNHIKGFKNTTKFYLLDAFDEKVFKVISDDFCKEIINECLFNSDNQYITTAEKFVYNYIKFGHGSIDERVGFITEKILNYKASIVGNVDYCEVHQRIHSLISELCSLLMGEQDKCEIQIIPGTLVKVFDEKIFNDVVIVEDKILLHLTNSYMQLPEKNNELLAKLILEVHKNIISEFGFQISHLFCNTVETFLRNVTQNEEKGYCDEFILNLLEVLVQADKTTDTKMLCLRLLPKWEQVKKADENMLFKIIDEIRLNADPVFQVNLHLYLVKRF